MLFFWKALTLNGNLILMQCTCINNLYMFILNYPYEFFDIHIFPPIMILVKQTTTNRHNKYNSYVQFNLYKGFLNVYFIIVNLVFMAALTFTIVQDFQNEWHSIHFVQHHELRKHYLTLIPKQIKWHFILWTYNHIQKSLMQCTIVQHKFPQHLKKIHTPKNISCIHIHKSFFDCQPLS